MRVCLVANGHSKGDVGVSSFATADVSVVRKAAAAGILGWLQLQRGYKERR